MNNLRKSLLAKVIAVVLFVISGVLAAASVIGVAFLADEGLYGETATYYHTGWCRSITHQYAYDAYSWYVDSMEAPYYGDYWDEANTNFSYEIVKASQPDTVLRQSYRPASVGFTAEFEIDDYIIRAAVKDPITANDAYFFTYRAFQLLHPMRYTIVVLLIVSGLVFVASLVFLFCAAGHRRSADGITLNMQDKIPFDIYLTGAILVVALLLSFGVNILYSSRAVELALAALAAVLALLVILATLLTTATRLKVGRWWKNTVIYHTLALAMRLIRAVWRVTLRFARGLPLVWKTVLIFCTATLINVMFAVQFFGGYQDGFVFFLGAAFNVILLFAFAAVSLNLQKLKKAGERLASGDFEHKVDTKNMYWDFKKHAENLNSIGDGMAIAVEQRMKSERLKTELITNVSHDIKTPLTSIINYVDLLEKEELEGKPAEYLVVLGRHANRLKKMTEDLVEASKASTGNVAMNLVPTDLAELINQSVGEYSERFSACRIDTVINMPEGGVHVYADGRLLWRVLDNLLGNCVKYSLPDTRVYIDVRKLPGEVAISIKNISRDPLNVSSDELMERFVRGDSARSSEGSGLGLNIAKSLVELQKGKFSLSIDGDLFKAHVILPEATIPSAPETEQTEPLYPV